MKINIVFFLAICSAVVKGFFRCGLQTKLRCKSERTSFFRCRKLGGCYRWTLLGSNCCFRATSASKPETHRSSYAGSSWSTNSIPTKSPQKTTVQQPYSANLRKQWGSTVPSAVECRNDAPRVHCGYRGIDSKQCQSRGCCWDATAFNLNKCFRPTNPAPRIRPQVSLPHKQVGKTIPENFSYESKFVGAKPPTKPSYVMGKNNFFWTPPTATTTTRNPDSFKVNNKNKLTSEEQKFLSQVNKELEKSSPTSKSVFPYLFLNRRLSGADLLNRRQYRLVTTSMIPTTTTTTTTNPSDFKRIIQLLIPRPQHQDGELAKGLAPVRSTQERQEKNNLHRAIAYLRLLHESRRNNGAAPSLSNIKKCEVESPDSCYLANPNGSCSGFRYTRGLLERSVPLPRVVGGTPAGNLRHSVAHLSKRPERQHFCGGTLLGRKWVLTAAHCVLSYCERIARDLIVSLGKYRQSSFPPERWQQDFDVIRVVCHPEQCKPAGKPRTNDMALLQLSRRVVYNSFVQPSLLPYPYEAPLANQNCMALGWGETKGSGFADVLKQVSVPAFSNEQCTHPDWRGCLVKSCMICAGDVNTDPCDGDSGGPLFCQRSNGLYVLHGIYSWGRCGASEKKPSIYTRTSHFIDWIYDVIRS